MRTAIAILAVVILGLMFASLSAFGQTNVTTLGGTANQVAKFTGTSTIGNSIITDNGSVGINNLSPLGTFYVNGTRTYVPTTEGLAKFLPTYSGDARGGSGDVSQYGLMVVEPNRGYGQTGSGLFVSGGQAYSGNWSYTIALGDQAQWGSAGWLTGVGSVLTINTTRTLGHLFALNGTVNTAVTQSIGSTDQYYGVIGSVTGTFSGTNTGQMAAIYGTNTATGSANIAGLFSATGGNANYGILVPNGNVGISTNTPVNKLDVGGSMVVGSGYSGVNSAPTDGLLVQGYAGFGQTSGFFARVTINESEPGINGLSATSTSGYGVYGNSTNYAGVLGVSPTQAGVWGVSTSGIGGDFNSTSGNALFASAQGPNYTAYFTGFGAQTLSNTTEFIQNNATSSTASINNYGLQILSNGTWNGTGAKKVGLHVTVTGGTSNFSAIFDQPVGINSYPCAGDMLSVNGQVHASSYITNTTFCDFVFDKGYPLMSLSEVEQHIKAEKHLPGIPSAKEVEEKGLNIGDMEVKMMQKIEELTLYVIDQDKKLKKLEDENTALELRLASDSK